MKKQVGKKCDYWGRKITKPSKPMTGEEAVVDDEEYEVGDAEDAIRLMAN